MPTRSARHGGQRSTPATPLNPGKDSTHAPQRPHPRSRRTPPPLRSGDPLQYSPNRRPARSGTTLLAGNSRSIATPRRRAYRTSRPSTQQTIRPRPPLQHIRERTYQKSQIRQFGRRASHPNAVPRHRYRPTRDSRLPTPRIHETLTRPHRIPRSTPRRWRTLNHPAPPLKPAAPARLKASLDRGFFMPRQPDPPRERPCRAPRPRTTGNAR
jgi:hypothetical protein